MDTETEKVFSRKNIIYMRVRSSLTVILIFDILTINLLGKELADHSATAFGKSWLKHSRDWLQIRVWQ